MNQEAAGSRPSRVDRRTRSDADVSTVLIKDFMTRTLPRLLERNGDVAAATARQLRVRPLTVVLPEATFTMAASDEGLEVSEGARVDAVCADMTAAQFSDFAQQLRTFNAMTVAHQLRARNGTQEELFDWDGVWLGLLEGWPAAAVDMTLRDRAGNPLELTRCFTPGDDPADIAHFLREAGYLHLRGWTDPAVMPSIAADIAAALPSYTDGDGRSWWATLNNGQRRCVRLQHFVGHSPATAALLRSERWNQLRRTLAGSDALVQAPVTGNCIEALVKPIGVSEGISDVPWHRDCNFGRHAYSCAGLILGISVTPGTPESGLLRAVAGSHRFAMPASRAGERSYLPVVPLVTATGDVTVHLSCTLHEAQPPLTDERLVMYTGFGLPTREGATASARREIDELRENAQFLQSQPASPVKARPLTQATSTTVR